MEVRILLRELIGDSSMAERAVVTRLIEVRVLVSERGEAQAQVLSPASRARDCVGSACRSHTFVLAFVSTLDRIHVAVRQLCWSLVGVSGGTV